MTTSASDPFSNLPSVESVTWPQVLAWRMRRQYLDGDNGPDPVQVARRLAGVQAQVSSSAALAIGIRQGKPAQEAVDRALTVDRTLLRTWAMRGTLHLLPVDEAGAYLAMAGAHRSWEKPSWQKASGATPADLEAMAEAATEALAGGSPLTREELATQIVDRTGSSHLAELLRSGWGMLLKPLASWGVLCHGPAHGNRITFVSPATWFPGWQGVPDTASAARTVIRAYLAAHGPATPESFDKVWLSRGFTRKPLLRSWFAALEDELATVDVEGTQMLVLADDLPELLDQRPQDTVRLLGAFDPYILGAGTGTTAVVPADHRAEVSRAAGWISPVVLRSGHAAGTWTLDGDRVQPTLWADVPRTALAAEVDRVGTVLGQELRPA